MKWEVLLYITPGGQAVVNKFIEDLDSLTRARVLKQIEMVETYGTDLRMPYSKSLGNGLVELRVRGNREIRIFYMYTQRRRVFLLHGFVKKTQTTPEKELKIARKRQKEVDSYSTYMLY